MLEVQIFKTVEKILHIFGADFRADFGNQSLHEVTHFNILRMCWGFVRNLVKFDRDVTHPGLGSDRGSASSVIQALQPHPTIFRFLQLIIRTFLVIKAFKKN
jgi:hypothetical protein